MPARPTSETDPDEIEAPSPVGNRLPARPADRDAASGVRRAAPSSTTGRRSRSTRGSPRPASSSRSPPARPGRARTSPATRPTHRSAGASTPSTTARGDGSRPAICASSRRRCTRTPSASTASSGRDAGSRRPAWGARCRSATGWRARTIWRRSGRSSSTAASDAAGRARPRGSGAARRRARCRAVRAVRDSGECDHAKLSGPSTSHRCSISARTRDGIRSRSSRHRWTGIGSTPCSNGASTRVPSASFDATR